jgi:WD40 repeat protein
MFSPDGTVAVTAPDSNAETTVDVWAVPDGPRTVSLRGATGTIMRLAFSPDDESLASAEWDRDGVHVWDFRTGKLRWAARHSSHAVCVEFSPDGKTLATGGRDNAVRLWDAKNGKRLRTLQPPGGTPVETVLWWPDGRSLLSGSRGGMISVMDTASGEIVQHFQTHNKHVRGLALSGDTKTVASCSTDKTLKLWDVE